MSDCLFSRTLQEAQENPCRQENRPRASLDRGNCVPVGHPVMELQCIAIGQVYLGNLHEDSCRKLTPKEIEYLKKC